MLRVSSKVCDPPVWSSIHKTETVHFSLLWQKCSLNFLVENDTARHRSLSQLSGTHRAPLLEAVFPNYDCSNWMARTGDIVTLDPPKSNGLRIRKVYIPSEGKGSLQRCRKVTEVSQLIFGWDSFHRCCYHLTGVGWPQWTKLALFQFLDSGCAHH